MGLNTLCVRENLEGGEKFMGAAEAWRGVACCLQRRDTPGGGLFVCHVIVLSCIATSYGRGLSHALVRFTLHHILVLRRSSRLFTALSQVFHVFAVQCGGFWKVDHSLVIASMGLFQRCPRNRCTNSSQRIICSSCCINPLKYVCGTASKLYRSTYLTVLSAPPPWASKTIVHGYRLHPEASPPHPLRPGDQSPHQEVTPLAPPHPLQEPTNVF